MSRVCALVLLLFAQQASGAVICRLVTGGGLQFGAYSPLTAAPLDSVANITVSCDRAGGPQHVTIDMALSQGTHGAGVASRRMRHLGTSGDYLSYGLYRDVARSSTWGFSTGVDTMRQTVSVPNNSSASITFIIYGRIPARQDVTAGSYSDSVQVTITP